MDDASTRESVARSQDAVITYVGHATVLIELNGLRLLTDPILRNRVSFLRRRKYPTLKPEQLGHIDAVLLSHLHHDHMDPPSLRMVGADVPLFAPRGSGQLLRKKGMRNVVEMSAGDKRQLGPLTIRATYADHNPQRHPLGASAECIGYVVEGEYSIYFPGDTDIFPGMNKLAEDLDVALLPVWGWGPTLGTGHMDPQRAAEALKLLQPKLTIPIHWGVFYPTGFGLFRTNYLYQPPRYFAAHAAEVAPDVLVRIVQPGKSLSLRDVLECHGTS